jgi:glycosyltransferase involved in cell wall biosynthesis
MPDEFRRAGLCVFPSRAEGLGIVVVEAMACGAPVIYMKDGVGPEVVTHGVDGLLCDTRDPDSIACTILQALSSPDLRRSLGARARQKVEAKFSLDKTTSENVRLYEELAKRRRHG